MTRRAIRLLVQGRENRLQFGLPGRYATFRAREIVDGGRSLNSSARIEPGSPNVRASIDAALSRTRCHQSDAPRVLHLSHSRHSRTFIEPLASPSLLPRAIETPVPVNRFYSGPDPGVGSNRPRFSERRLNVAKPYASGLAGVNPGCARARARDTSIARRNPRGSGEIIYVNPL